MSCENCKHSHFVKPAPYSTSNAGLGCLFTGGHAIVSCDAYEDKPKDVNDLWFMFCKHGVNYHACAYGCTP